MKLVGKAFCAASRALLCAAALLFGGPAQADAPVQVTQAQWQLTESGSFEPPTALPTLDESAWQSTSLPHQMVRGSMSGTKNLVDTAWFRFKVPRLSGGATDARLMLYVPRWQTVGQVAVFVDGRLLYRSRAGPVWNGFNHPLWIELGQPGAEAATVTVRIDHQRGAGLSLSTAWVGDARSLGARRLAREVLQAEFTYVASTAFLVVGLFALLVWVARREAAFGLFFICSGLFFVRSLHYHLGLEPLPISEDWFGWWTVQAMPALAIAINVFALRLANWRLRAVERLAVGVAAMAALAGLPPIASRSPAEIAPLLYLVTLVGFAAFCMLAIVATARARSREGLLVAAWNSLSIPAGVHDWLLQHHRIDPESVYLVPLAGVGLFSSFLFIVLARYVQALRISESAQQRLERELRAREAELQATYERLREVERQRILGAERERLMQDMHDGLGSSLISALKTAEHRQLDDLAEALRDCVDDLKLAIDSMEPVEADLLLLLGALRYRIGSRFEQAGIQLRWEVEEQLPRVRWLDPSASLQILRIVQEVFTNVLKHSRAGSTRLVARQEGQDILVVVEDDGVGFDPAATNRVGRGLANVRRRAAAIGGRVAWRPEAGRMRFELRLPIERQVEALDAVHG